MFFAGAVATLPALTASGDSVFSPTELWRLANETIWVENQQSDFGFWHVTAFAWVCNLAMHVGLSDMALLRFAKRPSYGLYSAFGMYLGHYLAWVCAGAMGAAVAVITGVALTKLDAGEVAYQALGFSGAIAVVLAGWSTSNPTLYRAGLALQAITPGWPRWLVTLLAGAFTTAVASFPFVFTRLLEFVGLYGILLMPIGAIVWVEHYVFPRIGLTRYWFSQTDRVVNWPALVVWFGAVSLACYLHFAGILHLFFVPLPIWFLTAIAYTLLSVFFGAKSLARASVELSPAGFPSPSRSVAPVKDAAPADSSGLSSLYSIVGIVALVALCACVALALWVGLSDSQPYAERLANYRAWLAWASVTHLVACAVWVMTKVR
jgi:NCS1 family nucleobase:cation symporter-1